MNIDYLNTYYNPDWVYKEIRNYFDIDELVRPEVIAFCKKRYGSNWENKAWSYLEFRMLSNLLYIRIGLNRSITVNHGSSVQRGMRDILCNMVISKVKRLILYLSSHVRGSGFDFNVKGMISEAVRDWIVAQGTKIPYKIRLEWKKKVKGPDKKYLKDEDGNYIRKPISWIHADSNYEPQNPHVYRFNI